MGIRENILSIRKDNGLTQEQLAKIAGVSRGAVSQWEGGFSEPRMGAIQRMADYFGIKKSDIIEDRGDKPSEGYVDIPVLSSIAAGQPIDLENVDDTFPIPERLHMRYPDAFLYRVEGDSMNRRIPDGCLVLVDKSDREPDGHSAYAVCVNGYSATVKRVKRLANGYELTPDSYDPTQRPMIFDYGINGTEEITVIGKVVWATMPFDYEI